MVKKIIIALLFLAALTGAYIGGTSTAQPPPARAIVKSTKIGIVNFVALYSQCDKVQALKKKVEQEIAPYKSKRQELEKLATDWIEVLRNPRSKLKESSAAKGRQIILDCKHQLEDLELKFKKEVSHGLEKEMGQVIAEINDRIREYGARHGFHLMLGYGAPQTPLADFPQLQLEVRAIDAGQVMQFYAAGGIDVTNDMRKILNDSFHAGQPVKDDQPR